MIIRTKSTIFLLLGLMGVMFGACTSLKMASYDQYSYQKTIDLKVRTLQIMDKAVHSFDQHKQETNNLLMEIEKMIVYEENRINNEVSSKMWFLLRDENKSFIGGFIKRWRQKGELSQIFIEEAKLQTAEAMDVLIRFEGRKDTQSKNNLKTLILKNE